MPHLRLVQRFHATPCVGTDRGGCCSRRRVAQRRISRRARLLRGTAGTRTSPHVRDDRDTSLLMRRDTIKMRLIWVARQCRTPAAQWHDGQLCMAYMHELPVAQSTSFHRRSTLVRPSEERRSMRQIRVRMNSPYEFRGRALGTRSPTNNQWSVAATSPHVRNREYLVGGSRSTLRI